MPDWGMQIRLSRVERGWSQQKLADEAGMPQATVSRIESGATENPSTETIDRLMSAMGGAPVVGTDRRRPLVPVGPRGALRELNVREMLGTEATEVDWIADGLVARGAVTMIAGREGAGKSLLSQAVAAAVVTGKSVADIACDHGRVLIIDAENGEQLIHQRVQMMSAGARKFDADRLRVLEAEGFDLDRDNDQLEAAITDPAFLPPDLLVLDSFQSLWFGNVASPTQVVQVLTKLRQVARAHRLGVLLIHHTTKTGETYKGNSAIGATIEAVYTFTRAAGDTDGNVRDLWCRKMRLGVEPPRRFLQIGTGGKFKAVENPLTVHDDDEGKAS